MPRPRSLDVDELLDSAERIVTEAGPSGLTLRSLADAAGVSNGSIYHAFSSKEELLARAWLRAARRLFELQRDNAAAAASADTSDDGVERVVATAMAPLDLAAANPSSARMFFAQRRDQLFSDQLPGALADDLVAVQVDFRALLKRLAAGVWQRQDRAAVDTIVCCVVDIPTGLLRRQLLTGSGLEPRTGNRLDAAVRAVLALPLPAPRRARTTTRKDRP
jgi:AcrR family transcriptional regulator